MTIYQDSKRIVGTSSERTSSTVSGVGGWKELARTTLDSSVSQIKVSDLPDKRYYMVLQNSLLSGRVDHYWRVNEDTGNNYAYRRTIDGNNSSTGTGSGLNYISQTVGNIDFSVNYWASESGKEKLTINQEVNNQGGTTTSSAPRRNEGVGKYTQTGAITSFEINNFDSGNFVSGAEMVVLGWDPDDTHTTNFWEQLATDSGAGSTLDTGTITAKKYLWVQCYCKPSSSSSLTMNFNSDTGGNYAIRESVNGGTDATNIQQASTDNLTGTATGGLFVNMFIINNTSAEKLWISHGQENTDGAVAGDRKEMVGRWVNTNDAITKITCNANFGATSELRVWGSN